MSRTAPPLSSRALSKVAPPKFHSPPSGCLPANEECREDSAVLGETVHSVGIYLAAALASLIILALITQLWRLDLSIPFSYREDSLLFHVWARSIADHGWYLTNPRLAAPSGSQMYDFPMADNLHFGLLKLLSFIDPRWPVIVNVYYLMTFPLATLSALFALRQLEIRGLSAVVASLLYAFLPYHWIRGEGHLFLSAYYLVPPAILVAVWIYLGQFSQPADGEQPILARRRRHRVWLSVLVCLLHASAGIYYAFFACFLFVVAGAAAAYRARSGHVWRLVLLLAGITGLGVAANTAPSIIYWWREGTNRHVGHRAVYESEIYGLKLAPLLLPVGFHNCPPLAKLRARYDRSSTHFNESASGTLGAVGSAGFLALLGWHVFATVRTRRQPLVDALATMNMATVLLGTVGGFGMLFSLLISPQFRASNRVSIFIAFFALTAVALWLHGLEQRWRRPGRRLVFYAFLGALLTLAIWDQSPAALRPGVLGESIQRTQFEADAAFAARMENLLPAGAAVYQMPYASFPESPPVEKMGGYEHFRPYLHAKSLRFSHACMRGRADDRWHQTIRDLPIEKLFDAIVEAGFAGIYIDRRGYADKAKHLETALAARLGHEPLVSVTGQQSFFVLSH